MTLPLGVQAFDPAEYSLKEKAFAAAPSAVLALVRSATAADDFAVIALDGAASRAHVSHTISAVNQILTLLNFPHTLRGYLDALLGLARSSEGNEFTATNKEVAKSLRSGRLGSSLESAERGLRRLKKRLAAWQQKKNFELVTITPGKFNKTNWRNETTRYKIFLLEIVDEVLKEAAQNPFFTAAVDAAQLRRLQGIAIRRAAARVLWRIPNAPSIRPERAKTLSRQERFDRRHHTALTFLEKNRDELAEEGIAHEEYFYYFLSEADKICFNPAGSVGKLLTAKDSEPDKTSSVWRQLKTGEISDLLTTREIAATGGDTFETGENKVTNFNPENDSKLLQTLDEEVGTHDQQMSSPPEPEIDMKQSEIKPILEAWRASLDAKMPPPEPTAKFTGAWEINWSDQSLEAERTAGALDFAVIKCEQKNLGIEEVKARFIDFVMARLVYWRDGVPRGASSEKLNQFRNRLESFLIVPKSKNRSKK